MFLNNDYEVIGKLLNYSDLIFVIILIKIYIEGSEIYDKSNFKLSWSITIGGTKEGSRINKKFGMTKGLKGAIQRVNIY